MKKIMAGMMSACIAFGTFLSPVMANTSEVMTISSQGEDSEESVNLTNAILNVKKKIEIPSDLSEFSYRFNNSNYEKKQYWNLTWRNEDYSKSINVRVDNNGRILAYSTYNNKEDGNYRPTYLKSELKEDAITFIKKIAPEISENIVLKEVYFDGIYSGTYNYVFERIENGVRMPDDTVRVTVNYETKEVKSFTANWTYDVLIPSSDTFVTLEKAKEIIGENVEMQLKYMKKYEETDNEDERTIKAYLVYVPSKSYIAVDAKTGEIYETHDEFLAMEESEKLESSNSMAFGAMADSLTAEELEKIEEIKGLISKEEAINVITSKKDILLLDDNAKAVSATLSKNYSNFKKDTGDYVWNLSFSDPRDVDYNAIDTYRAYISATVDAKTGKILYYRSSVKSYYDDKSDKWEKIDVKYSNDECQKVLENFIKDTESDKFNLTKLSNSNSNAYVLKVIDDNKVYGGYSYSYVRMNEGIEYNYNSISGAVDGVTGKIYSYNCNWDDNVEFESPKTAMSAKEAYDAYSNCKGFELVYEVNNKHYIDENPDSSEYYNYEDLYSLEKEVRLVYRTNIYPQYISPFTGRQLDYNGDEYEDINTKSYTDISEFWGRRNIELITDMGYIVEGNEFLPNNVINKEEFSKLLETVGKRIDEEDYKKLDSISKIEAIKIMLKGLGLESIAEISDIYKTSFTDVYENIGYVALAEGLGIVNGDASGLLYPDKELTRIEAVCMALNLANIRVR